MKLPGDITLSYPPGTFLYFTIDSTVHPPVFLKTISEPKSIYVLDALKSGY